MGLPLAVAHREGRTVTGGDDQILLPVEEERQREGALEPVDHGQRRLDRAAALGHPAGRQGGHDLGVGVGLEGMVGQFRAQFAPVLDDAVVDDGHGAAAMGMGVAHRGAPWVAQRVCPMPERPGRGSATRRSASPASLPCARRRSSRPSETVAIPALS